LPFSFQIESGGRKPQRERLEMRTRVFRDGIEVWQSSLTPVSAGPANFKGALVVPKDLGPGRYLIRVDVRAQGTPDAASAWQWANLRVR